MTNKTAKKVVKKVEMIHESNPFRPRKFTEYIGQDGIKAHIKCMISASVKRNVPINHILISSTAPGTGKTTLARIIANESGRDFIETNASALEKPSDVYTLFKRANKFYMPIIFIDEIHALKNDVALLLYTPMEDFGGKISNGETIGDGREGTLDVYPFTLIGATDGRQGLLAKPFLDRFKYKPNLKMYNNDQISKIVANSAKKVEVVISPGAQQEVIKRACYTPRIANSLLESLRDYAVAGNKKTVTQVMASTVFERMDLDELGLDDIGRTILKALYKSNKMRLGLMSIAQSVRLDVKTIQYLYEPQLLTHDLIAYLPNGRALTEEGEEHIKKYLDF